VSEPVGIEPALRDGPVIVYLGAALSVLRQMPAESVHMVCTSPPYWRLRDYGTAQWEGGDPLCAHRHLNARPDHSRDRKHATRGEQPAAAAAVTPMGDVCSKCGARRAEPTVWGGDLSCDHQWGADILVGDPTRGNRGSTLSGSTRTQERASRWCASSTFCSRCGAWRGALGLEPTPQLYVGHIVEVFREVRRVLRADGTCWLNLGDSYAGSWGAQGHRDTPASLSRNSIANHPKQASHAGTIRQVGLKPKDLVGIPWRVALALVADGWWLRSDDIEEVELYCPCGCGHVMEERVWRYSQDRELVWKKPNPMPESVTDRPTKAHEYLFLLTKRGRYFYDNEAVRESVTGNAHSRGTGVNPKARKWPSGWDPDDHGRAGNGRFRPKQNESFSGAVSGAVRARNLRSVWEIATQPYPGAHFATFPEDLVVPCIKAGTSDRGCCPECGAPWQRVVERSHENPGNRTTNGPRSTDRRHETAGFSVRLETRTETAGWQPDCWCGGERSCAVCGGSGWLMVNGKRVRCRVCCKGLRKIRRGRVPIAVGDPITATVLDPFVGSGTTLAVARRLGCRSIGIELEAGYLPLIQQRVASAALPLLDVLVEAAGPGWQTSLLVEAD
jgi:DNA modification methylase